MKSLFWNIRGIGNPGTRVVLKKLCDAHHPDFLFIAEPWIALYQIPESYWINLNLKSFSVNDRGTQLHNLWGLCSLTISPTVLATSSQHISFSFDCDGMTLFSSAVYASTSYRGPRSLWSDLSTLQYNHTGPWSLIGDFNAVTGSHEMRGSGMPLPISCEEFKLWSESCGLHHLSIRGAEFTWSNGRRGRHHTEKRLDRSLCNDSCLDYWHSAACCTLIRSKSDHYPLLLVSK